MNDAALSQVLDDIQDGIAIFDMECRFVRVNKVFSAECRRLYGADIRPGISVLSLCEAYPQWAQQWLYHCKRALAGDSNTYVCSIPNVVPGGAHHRISFKPLYDNDGEVTGAFMLSRNVSHELSFYQDMLHANAHLHQVQAAMDACAMVALLDERARIIRVNQMFCEATGLPAPALVGLSFGQIISQVESPCDADEIWRTLKTGNTWHNEVAYNSADSSLIWVDATVSPFSTGGGQGGYLVICFNITARKQQELKARENEQFYRSVLENLPVGLHQYTADGWSVDLNNYMRDILGENHLSVNGLPYNVLGDPINRHNGLNALFEEVIRRRVPVKKEILLKYTEVQSGAVTRIQPAYYEATGFPVIGQQNELAYMFLILSEITEKKLAELSLEKSERLLNNIVENLPIGYIQFDNFGFIRRVNQTQRLFFGNVTDGAEDSYNMINDPFAKLFELDQLFMQVLQHGKMVRTEKRLDLSMDKEWSKQEREVYLDLTMFPVYDPVDKDQIVVALVNDITDKKRQEIENAKSQEFMLQTGEIGKIGGWEIDVPSYRVRWSPQTYRIHELPPHTQMSMEKMGTFFSDDERMRMEEAILDCTQYGKSFDVQLTLVTARNNSIKIRMIGRPEFKNGRIVRIHGVIQDITEQFQIRDQLSRNTELMSLFFDTIDMGYAIMGQDGKVNFINKKAEEIIDHEAVVGNNIFEVFPWLVGSTFHAKVNECIEHRRPVSFINYLPQTNTWYEFLLASMQDGSLSIFTRNITSSRRMQKELRKANEQLLSLNKYLVNQNKQLEDFAHITSHNLRAPIANLKALMQIYNNTESENERELYINMQHDVIMNIDETLNDLIEIVQIRKDLNLERESLSFQERLQRIKEILTVDIETSGIRLTSDFSDSPDIEYPKIYLDSILQNLLTNAIKYRANDRSPMVHFQSRKVDGGVMLTAEDNGVGIDLDRYGHKLFGFRKTFHKNKDAKGIGLFITKSQIEAMGGNILAESKPGKGTKFIITFRPE
ncbi:PAS domain S-box protein [Chitinophaga horti]|uniref:histidine kinase n=1 Tax=Chitinophaga horti TaxID=2920382 RepID=A0ABY6J8T5_9BACT|nr:PAS domain S-box protein [Chitinophaga horti]UYQ94727.1 PAS domain S-box protein [Chitinophaga horti]